MKERRFSDSFQETAIIMPLLLYSQKVSTEVSTIKAKVSTLIQREL